MASRKKTASRREPRESVTGLLERIRGCRECARHLPFAPRPIVSFAKGSRVILVGQAPGLRVQKSGVPWDDASGERLRAWLGVQKADFYDSKLFGIVPMGFCYPGKGKSGDLPPRPECAPLWMERALDAIGRPRTTLLIGSHAQQWFLGDRRKGTATETIRNWKHYRPEFYVLPHPSPRNNIWLKKNPWFERDVVPDLRRVIRTAIRR